MYAAGGLVLVVFGFYCYARYRAHSLIRKLPQLQAEVKQSSEGFTFSKSENGRTLFTIHAAKSVEYKQGGRAELHDVNIIVYGKGADRFDQIYGSVFQYDPVSGDVVAQGDVQIDLENNTQGRLSPDQAPPQILKNLVHIKTRGLSFNQKTGYAVTHEAIEFRMPQASACRTCLITLSGLPSTSLVVKRRIEQPADISRFWRRLSSTRLALWVDPSNSTTSRFSG